MSRVIFVSAIGTDVGKTVVSSILVEALKADYWKPVQCGELDNSDSLRVASLISNQDSIIHQETFRLKTPLSPHAAAAIENIRIGLEDFKLPGTSNTLVIEGAGGLMVPLNDKLLILDLIALFKAEVVLVSKHYLGSINHTLLSLEVLRQRHIPLLGVVFNGERNQASEEAILTHSGAKSLGRLSWEKELTPALISRYALKFREMLL